MSRLLLITLMTLPLTALAGDLTYPDTKTVEQSDDYHGTLVPDPYRWLENDVRTDAEVAAWVAAENQVTTAYLESIPERQRIKQRLTELWDYAKYGSPFKAGGRYYFFKNDGLQNQAVLYVQEALDAEPRVLLDPNLWSKDGTIALGSTAFSDDGKFLAYSTSEAGSDWNTWHVLEIATTTLLSEEVRWSKFSGAAWTRDGRGFFYGRYPEPQDGAAFQSLNLNQKLYYHIAGTPQSDDILVYERPDHPEWGLGAEVSEDGRYLVITAWKGTDNKYKLFLKDLTEPFGLPRELIGDFDFEYGFIGNDGTTFFLLTDRDAPKKRIVAIDIKHPAELKELVPQADDVLANVNLVGNQFVCAYLHDAATLVKLFSPAGQFVRSVSLPGLGTASGFGGKRGDVETFYSFSSFATPPSIYRYDLLTGESKLLRRAEVDVDPANYEVKQVFVSSKDGTRVPLFITHKKGLTLDGNNPTLLYGYGGFAISITPGFSISRLQWLEMGGVLAVANLRGGGEYGEEWHQGGTKLNKQNVFDDFIGSAQWLIDNHYTRPEKLAIQGGSNGGLLVGAAMTQRPDLFAAALPAVGVMDMLRFHKFTAGRFWVDDYGSADDPEQFAALYRYSPYHSLRTGIRYPATLITTADTDDRVVPGHSFKFAARLQQMQQGEAPVLIRIETRAGHGAGKPTEKVIEEVADQWAFLVQVLGMEVPTK